MASEIKKYQLLTSDFGLHTEIYNEEEENGSKADNNKSGRLSTGQSVGNLTTIAGLASEHKVRIAELWEEPELARGEDENVDIASVIQFRQSLSYLCQLWSSGYT